MVNNSITIHFHLQIASLTESIDADESFVRDGTVEIHNDEVLCVEETENDEMHSNTQKIEISVQTTIDESNIAKWETDLERLKHELSEWRKEIQSLKHKIEELS